MKRKTLWTPFVLSLFSFLMCSPSFLTSAESEKKKAVEAEQEAWMKSATPSEKHQFLDALVGRWNTHSKWWMNGPNGEITEAKGTVKNSWVLGKRFVFSEFESEWGDEEFEGLGYTGYDNLTKNYVGTWLDNASTGIIHMTGQVDKAGQQLTMKGLFTDLKGRKIKSRYVTSIQSKDKHIFEMFHTEPGKKEMKMGEITYTRR